MVQVIADARCSTAWWLAAVLLCSAATALRPSAGAARTSGSREHAFIGYQEDGGAVCKDRVPHDCQLQASKAGCLADPFTMRAMCQQSCGTGACRDQQQMAQVHKHRMRGRASPYGTWSYAKAFRFAVARNHFIEVDLMNTNNSKTTLLLSSLGTGTYLGDPDASTDEAVTCAILHSVMHGWNVIDTASNYRSGRAEAAVGHALEVLLVGNNAHEFAQAALPGADDTDDQTHYSVGEQQNRWLDDPLGSSSGDVGATVYSVSSYMGANSASGSGRAGSIGGGVGLEQLQALRARRAKISADVAATASDITRDMLFISTKAGFVSDGERKALLSGGKVRASDFVSGHCMHPECLRASLLQSLERLGLDSVDVLYVHNPAEAQLVALGRTAFMERLKAAFVALEAMRQEGLLGVYGLATWDCFRVPSTSKLYLSLEDVVALAVEAGGTKHGFRAVQLPINAAMAEAWSQPWQYSSGAAVQAGQTLMEAAGKLGVRVFASGPLMEGELLSRPTLQLDAIPALATLPSAAAKLLQLSRSTPGLTSALVGHKRREHVEANHEVAMEPRLTPKRFKLVHEDVVHALALAGATSTHR